MSIEALRPVRTCDGAAHRPAADAALVRALAGAMVLAVGLAGCRGFPRPADRAPGGGTPTTAATSPIPPELAAKLLPWDHAVAVDRVVDGDTLRVFTAAHRSESVRLIGLNAPETGEGDRAVQCFGRQAAEHLSAVLDGHMVWLAGDPSQGERDRYGRLLAYVWLADAERPGDGSFVNRALIADGYANEATYERPYALREDFRAAAAAARAADRGLWAPSTCDGDYRSPPIR